MQRTDSLEKTLSLGKIEGRGEEDEMVGWHHQFSGHKVEQAPGDGEEQVVCCSPWSHRELDMTE